MSYYTTGSGSIMLQIPSDTARRQLYDDLLGRYDQLCSEEMSQCGEQMAKSVQGEYQRRKCQMKRYDDPLWWLTTVLNDVGFVELERGMETDDFFIERPIAVTMTSVRLWMCWTCLCPIRKKAAFPISVKTILTGDTNLLMECGLNCVGRFVMRHPNNAAPDLPANTR